MIYSDGGDGLSHEYFRLNPARERAASQGRPRLPRLLSDEVDIDIGEKRDQVDCAIRQNSRIRRE